MSGEHDLLTITTPLPETSFGIASINGSERLSRPFQYNIQLHSGSALLDPNDLLDKPVTVKIATPLSGGDPARYVNGIVYAVRQLPSQSTALWQYEISVVPKLWFLDQTKDCRFYQKQSVLDIVKYVLGKFSITLSDKTTGSFPTRDYVVQFNESYLHFIQRLMEDAGIFYFFTHSDGAHTMVLANANTAFVDIDEPQLSLDETNAGFGVLNSWHRVDRTALGSVRTDDYNPETDQLQPGAISGTEPTVLQASAAAQRMHYAWPARRGVAADASTLAKSRMLAAEAGAQLYTGSGQVADLVAGGKFTLVNDPSGTSTEYVIKSLSYHITDNQAGGGAGHRAAIAASIIAFPSKITYQEETTFLPPVMAGMYSAVVIGPSGEEIYTDDLGRIQVQFPFDHEGDITTDKTLWVRVMQGWSGNNWGTQYIPRIGMEVVVAFLEGDVNRPVVVGCLFNGNNKPVFAAAEKNKSGLRTRSTMQGGTANFSEFSIDDTKGSEAVYLHAEKDLNIEVENNRSVTVTKDETVKIDGKKTDTVKGDYATTVSQGNESLTVSQGTITHSAAQSITLKVGGNSIKIDTSSITLTVGGSTVKLTDSEVDVTGIQVKVTGQAQTAVKGAIVQVSGDGMLELKGAMTMINS
ncbi:MAG: type VI secretion system tip protein VgrG [Rhodospirillales bacterium]|nr:type VI secretion system tip protein VgrG [Rhodospirillales bacterium]